MTDLWADLEEDFEAELARTPEEKTRAFEAAAIEETGIPAPLTHEETCSKCRGTGHFRAYTGRVSGPCFACNGKGTITRRTSPEARQKAKQAKEARKLATVENWSAANPQAAAWIVAKADRFDFARSMKEALTKYGSLTEAQLATVERLRLQDSERDAQRAQEKVSREASAPAVTIEAIETAFQHAFAAQIKNPKLRLADFVFTPAKAHSKNAGAVYVTRDGAYLGKIAAGKFMRSFECDAVIETEVVKVASDPRQAAIAYGQKFGSCSCCGRELTNPESIALGIGPVCASKFGW